MVAISLLNVGKVVVGERHMCNDMPAQSLWPWVGRRLYLGHADKAHCSGRLAGIRGEGPCEIQGCLPPSSVLAQAAQSFGSEILPMQLQNMWVLESTCTKHPIAVLQFY